MFIIFWLPLAAGAGLLTYLLTTDMDLKWKILASALLAASVAMQFYPPLQVHFIIPLLMQVTLCFWGIFHYKISGG